MPLYRAGMGDTAAVEVGLAADKQLKFYRMVIKFHPQEKRAVVLMSQLGGREKVWRQFKPVEADHCPLF